MEREPAESTLSLEEVESLSDSESKIVNRVSNYSYSDLRALSSLMQNDGSLVYDRRYKLKKFHNCFVGSDAVSWLVEKNICPNQSAAVELGNLMLKEGLLHHVTHEHSFKNEKLFYRFSFKSAFADHTEVVELQELIQKQTNEIFELMLRVAALENYNANLNQYLRIGTLIAASLFTFCLLPHWMAVGVIFCGIFPLGFVYISDHLSLKRRLKHLEMFSESGKADKYIATIPSSNRKASEQKNVFPVSAEEVVQMKKELQELFGDQVAMFQDEYLKEVMKQADSKKPTQRRTFEYSKSKFVKILESRKAVIKSFKDEMSSSEFYRTETVTSGSLYWHGYDVNGIPILWVRSKLKNWDKLVIEKEVRLHMEILDAGIKLMPPGITSFHIISDASGLGWKETNVSLMKELLYLLMRVYPDRLESLHAGPVNSVLKTLASILLKLMPARISSKIYLMSKKPFYHLTIEHQLLPSDKIPDFFGGQFHHSFEEVGKFSFDKMIQRQTLLLEEYLETKKLKNDKNINHT